MPKSVEEKLKSATRTIEALKRQLAELEGVVQAHATVQNWRQMAPLAQSDAAKIACHIASRRGKSVLPRKIGFDPAHGAGYVNTNLFIIDDPWLGPTGVVTMAQAHLVINANIAFDKTINKRTAYDGIQEAIAVQEEITKAFAVPSEHIGIDMADSPGTAASVEARIEAGNIILHNLATPPCSKDALFEHLEGLDPDVTAEVWALTATQIAGVYSRDVIGGIELFHDWAKGSLGGFPLPVSYSEHRTNRLWSEIIKSKGVNE